MSAGMGWDHDPDPLSNPDDHPTLAAAYAALAVVLLAGAVVWSSCAPVVPPVVGMCP